MVGSPLWALVMFLSSGSGEGREKTTVAKRMPMIRKAFMLEILICV